jgi:adenylate kinase
VQREDDAANVIRDRLRIFAESTRPLVEYYREHPAFAAVDGRQAPDAVTRVLRAHVEKAAGIAPVDGARGARKRARA